jgi:DNA polymerase I-like protein with 3'-5' exonuclease and polymerase domains
VPETEAANHPIQGGAADIVGERTLLWIEYLKMKQVLHTRVWPNLQIHDALYAEVDEDYAEEAARDLAFCLVCEKTVRSVVTGQEHTMRFSVDVSIGPDLYSLKERPDLVGGGR